MAFSISGLTALRLSNVAYVVLGLLGNVLEFLLVSIQLTASFTHHAPVHWNTLPKQLRQPSPHESVASATESTPLIALSS